MTRGGAFYICVRGGKMAGRFAACFARDEKPAAAYLTMSDFMKYLPGEWLAAAGAVTLLIFAIACSDLFWPWPAPKTMWSTAEEVDAATGRLLRAASPAATEDKAPAIADEGANRPQVSLTEISKLPQTEIATFNIGSVSIYRGMPADSVFQLLGRGMIIGQQIEEDKDNPPNIIVTKIYRVKERTYRVVFRKPVGDKQYRASAIFAVGL